MKKRISIEKQIEIAAMRYQLCHKYIEKIIQEIFKTPKDCMLWIFVEPIFGKKLTGELTLIKTTNEKVKSKSSIDYHYEPEWYITAFVSPGIKPCKGFNHHEFRREILSQIDEAIYEASPTAKYRERFEKG